jgi:hypothetical protein
VPQPAQPARLASLALLVQLARKVTLVLPALKVITVPKA